MNEQGKPTKMQKGQCLFNAQHHLYTYLNILAQLFYPIYVQVHRAQICASLTCQHCIVLNHVYLF